MSSNNEERIRLLWRDGKSIPEIAEELKITRGVVSGIIHRCRKRDGESEWQRKQSPRPAKAEPDREPDDNMDGDHASALASAGFGTDEDYA